VPRGYEDLLAVDDILVAVAPRRGAHCRDIASARGFAHAKRSHDVPGCHSGKPTALLRLGAVVHEVGGYDFGLQVERRSGGAGAGHFLDHDGTEQKIASGTTVFFRHPGAEQTEFAGCVPNRARNDPGLFPIGVMRRDLGCDEAADLVAEQVVFGGEEGTRDHGAHFVI
jgi:hypothetical protein